MQKKSAPKTKLTKEEVEERLAQMEKSQQLADISRELASGGAASTVTATGEVELENLSGVGMTEDKLYSELVNDYKELLEKIGDLAFSDFMRERYFKNGKLKTLIRVMQKAGMTLESRAMMDIFRTRVKQKNGGKLPTIQAKSGLFGKVTERVMKPEEIMSKYEVEVDLPPGEERPLSVCGTQNSMLMHLRSTLLDNDDVVDPMKRGARKSIARFLGAAGLINASNPSPKEKFLVAVLVTPDAHQPRSTKDKDRIIKFRSIIARGNKWLDELQKKIEASTNKKGAPPKEKKD